MKSATASVYVHGTKNRSVSDKRALVFLLRKYAKPYGKEIAFLVVLSVVAAFMLPMTALVLAPALHVITVSSTHPAERLSELSLNNIGPTLMSILGMDASNSWNIIIVVTVAYVLTSIIYSVMNFGAYIMAMHIRTHMARNVTVDLHRHILTLPISFFQKQKTGDLITRFTEDARGTSYALDSVVRGILQSGIQIVVSILILFKTEPMLSIAAIVLASGHFGITRLLGNQLKLRMLAQNTALGRLSSVLQEALLSIRVIKSFAAEKFEMARFRVEADNHKRWMMRFVFTKHIEEPLRFIADAMAISLILLLTFQAMRAGRLSLEGFGLFIILARQVIGPISMLSTHALAASGMLGSARRVMDIFNTRNSLSDGEIIAQPLQNELELKNIYFSYGDNMDVLKGVNFRINKGETIAFVGPSGGGKSTLVDIILRLYDPVSGSVVMDGLDIRTLKQESYRKLFGVVPQECQLFNSTVRENIVYGREKNEQQLMLSIAVANAGEFIDSLPKGLETVLGERGTRLSGGQRQRIAIARALYGNPSILILDEATSSLDNQSERVVQSAIDNVIKGRTAIVIAHRLSTIRNADRIVVVNEGRIEAIGTHNEALSTSETYKKLYKAQDETH